MLRWLSLIIALTTYKSRHLVATFRGNYDNKRYYNFVLLMTRRAMKRRRLFPKLDKLQFPEINIGVAQPVCILLSNCLAFQQLCYLFVSQEGTGLQYYVLRLLLCLQTKRDAKRISMDSSSIMKGKYARWSFSLLS